MSRLPFKILNYLGLLISSAYVVALFYGFRASMYVTAVVIQNQQIKYSKNNNLKHLTINFEQLFFV